MYSRYWVSVRVILPTPKYPVLKSRIHILANSHILHLFRRDSPHPFFYRLVRVGFAEEGNSTCTWCWFGGAQNAHHTGSLPKQGASTASLSMIAPIHRLVLQGEDGSIVEPYNARCPQLLIRWKRGPCLRWRLALGRPRACRARQRLLGLFGERIRWGGAERRRGCTGPNIGGGMKGRGGLMRSTEGAGE
jgi:hypothetical protein